jgi:hypothetical protein
MSTPTRVLAFALGLAAVFGLALGAGRLANPDPQVVATHTTDGHADHADHETQAAAASVHLALAERSVAPGADVPVSFRIEDTLTDFQHVHPTRAADGTWTVPLRLAPGTSYRLYADGSTGGTGFLATADLFTTGSRPQPGAVPGPATRDQVDGLTADLHQADGRASLTVTRDGQPVTLQPYLGALGHLVVIRVDDLSYLHVHPEAGDAPAFAVAGLAPGRYRYFFDFQVDGVVHTTAFTHDVGQSMPMGTEEHDDDQH